MKLTKRHYILFLIFVTESLGFSLILPFLPFLAQKMGASNFIVGLLLTTFSICQFIAAPIIGQLSDKYGRKPLIIISQLATLAGFIILAFANQLWLLFLSRIVDGLLGSNDTVAKAYLSDITNKKDRSKVFGITGTAFGIGFLVGPALGGSLTQFGYQVPSLLAAFMTLISILLTIFLLTETVDVNKTKLAKIKFRIFNFSKLKYFLTNSSISTQLTEFATFTFASALFTSNLSLLAKAKYQVTEQDIGLALTMVGGLLIINRSILLQKLIKLFGERKLERIGMISIICGLIITIFAKNWSLQLLAIIFFATGSGVNFPLMMGDISRSANKNEQGSVMGISSAIRSFSEIVSPLLGGLALSSIFPNSYLVLAIMTMMYGFYLVLKEKKAY